MYNGLIVVHDIDTLKRLIYYLRLSIQRNTENVKEYYRKSFIQNYYVDITDFNKHPNQLILFGDESIENLINEIISDTNASLRNISDKFNYTTLYLLDKDFRAPYLS